MMKFLRLLFSLTLFALLYHKINAQEVPGNWRLNLSLNHTVGFDRHNLTHFNLNNSQTEEIVFSPSGGTGLVFEGGTFINKQLMLSMFLQTQLIGAARSETLNDQTRTTRASGFRLDVGLLPSFFVSTDFSANRQNHYIAIGPFISTLPNLSLEENSEFSMDASSNLSINYMIRYTLEIELKANTYIGGSIAYRGGQMNMGVDYNEGRYQGDFFYREWVDGLKNDLEDQSMNGIMFAFNVSTYLVSS